MGSSPVQVDDVSSSTLPTTSPETMIIYSQILDDNYGNGNGNLPTQAGEIFGHIINHNPEDSLGGISNGSWQNHMVVQM